MSNILLFIAFPEHAAVAPSLAAGACGLLVDVPITAREFDVLRLLSINTVKTYPQQVVRNLDALNRAQVISNARQFGLL